MLWWLRGRPFLFSGAILLRPSSLFKRSVGTVLRVLWLIFALHVILVGLIGPQSVLACLWKAKRLCKMKNEIREQSCSEVLFLTVKIGDYNFDEPFKSTDSTEDNSGA